MNLPALMTIWTLVRVKSDHFTKWGGQLLENMTPWQIETLKKEGYLTLKHPFWYSLTTAL